MPTHLPTVLIVEDDPVFRRVMSFTVAQAGANVENASNGIEGFDQFMKGGIDFLVTDLQMPRSNGIELLQRIAAQRERSPVPTILCTAKGLELDTQELIQQFNLVTVMRKPFSPRRLSELIIQAVGCSDTVTASDALASAVPSTESPAEPSSGTRGTIAAIGGVLPPLNSFNHTRTSFDG